MKTINVIFFRNDFVLLLKTFVLGLFFLTNLSFAQNNQRSNITSNDTLAQKSKKVDALMQQLNSKSFREILI
jgi:hypothetical protein